MINLDRSPARHGFSLLEMSVVIGIIALVIGFGMSLGTNAVKSAERVSTQERLTTIKAALEEYVKANGYLPCPFDRMLTPANDPDTFGMEARAGIACTVPPLSTSLIDTGGMYIGGLPVRNLGLPDSYAADAWDNKFLYAVTQAHVSSATSYIRNEGQVPLITGDASVVSHPLTTSLDRHHLTTPTSGDISPATDPLSLALPYYGGASYVVLSHGPDGRGAYPIGGASVAEACDGGNHQNDIYNCDDTDTPFIDTAYNDGANPTLYFDDFIIWGSNANARAEIRSPADLAGGGYSGGCPIGTCELWCAQCTGASDIAHLPTDPTGFSYSDDSESNGAKLCKKIITSYATCSASCVWAGELTALSASTPGNTIVRCP